MRLLYSVLMGLWRDCFGKDGYNIPVLKLRIVQHIIAFLMTTGICWWNSFVWYWCLWIALWVQVEWALGHGPCYDLGTSGKPDAKTKKRYEEMVGCKLLYKIFPQKKWYTFWFDFCLLTIRYTYPLIPICFLFSPVFMLLGVVITCEYAAYRYIPFLQKHRLLDVEIWAGLAVGLFIAYL